MTFINHGTINSRTLDWMREGLVRHLAKLESVGFAGAARQSEIGLKEELSYHLFSRKRVSAATLNGQKATEPAPMFVAALVQALKAKNRESISDLDRQIKQAVESLSDEERGANGQDFLSKTADEWLFSYATLQLMKPDARDDPVHYDGGAALLLLAVTLYGHRTLTVFEQKGTGKQQHTSLQVPGIVYLASLCAAEHQVGHSGDDEDCLDVDGHRLKVVLLIRCGCFRKARGTVNPGPTAVFQAVQKVVVKWQVESPLVLPTLSEMTAEARAMPS